MKRLLICLLIVSFFSSCKVFNPSLMLRTKAGYVYSQYNDTIVEDYRIAPDDIIQIMVLPNNGERLLSVLGDQGNQSSSSGANEMSYVVDNNGNVKLPVLGMTQLGGLTQKAAEDTLQKKFSAFINAPYVRITISNRRVFIFRGGNQAAVVNLDNQNTTLFEVLAKSGGIDDAKAHRIKLIRKIHKETKVFLIDLSKVENIDQGNIVLQSNDVIYITPRYHVPEKALSFIAPFFSIIATAIAVIALFK